MRENVKVHEIHTRQVETEVDVNEKNSVRFFSRDAAIKTII